MAKFFLGIVFVCLSLPVISGGCRKVPLMGCACDVCDCVSCECSDQRVLDVVRQELAKGDVSRALDNAEVTQVSTTSPAAKPAASVTDGVVFSDDPLPAGAVITHIDGVPVAKQYAAPVYAQRTYTGPLSTRRVYAQQPANQVVVPQTVYRRQSGRLFQSPTSGTCRIVNGVKICN
jgi:hypothetical protein